MEGKVAVVQSHQEIGILTEHCYFGENNILQPQRVSSYGQVNPQSHLNSKLMPTDHDLPQSSIETQQYVSAVW